MLGLIWEVYVISLRSTIQETFHRNDKTAPSMSSANLDPVFKKEYQNSCERKTLR